MIIFFDIGLKGAVSVFERNKLKKVIKYHLNAKAKNSCKEKILQFQNFINKTFRYKRKIKYIGCFKPFGINRKTIINLSMMSAMLVVIFQKSNFVFVNEWNAWKKILNQKQILKREIKKELTIQWAKKKFLLKYINDDEADAIMGGYWIQEYLKK